MSKMPHTGCHRGKRVLIRLRDGTRISDVFHERNDKHIFLVNAGKIRKNSIKSFVIVRK